MERVPALIQKKALVILAQQLAYLKCGQTDVPAGNHRGSVMRQTNREMAFVGWKLGPLSPLMTCFVLSGLK